MAFRTNKTPVLQEKSASGSVASFNTALAMPLASCNIAINAYQEGTGEPSPVNVRNIVPRREVNIYQRGINLWDEQWELGTYNTTTGEKANSTTNIRSTNKIPVIPNTNYCFVIDYVSTIVVGIILKYDVNGDFIGIMSWYGGARVTNIPNDTHYLTFYLGTGYGTTYNNNISINYPSTDTSYHAYNGNDYLVNLGEDVYGAVYNSVTGGKKKTVNKVVLNGTENWNERAASNGYYITLSDMKPQTAGNGLCNWLKRVTSLTGTMGIQWGAGNNKAIYAIDVNSIEGVTNVTTWKAYLEQHPLEVTYELETPIESTGTPTPINTFNGDNNIFCDTGDTSLTYKDLDIAKRGNFREVFKLPS